MSASIYVLVSLGLTLALSVVGIVQLAHGQVYMLGAYATYLFCETLGLNYVAALILATILIGLLGIGLERVVFRPVRKYSSFWPSVMMATGLMLVLQTIATASFGSTSKVVATPIPGVLAVFGATISLERLVIIGTSFVCVVAMIMALKRTRMGQAMMAVSQDLEGAALQGVNINHVAALTMFLGCALAGLAGGLMGAIFNMSPSMGDPILIKGIAVIILGGLGSVPGVIIGSLILGFVDSIVPIVLNSQVASLVGFVVIVLILIARPQGILGRAG
jgi:branched-chain amino acid transport system permease protein